MKIYTEGNFYQYNSTEYEGTVHESAVGLTAIGTEKIRISLDLVGRRGEVDVQETFLFADCKNLLGVAHGHTYLSTVTSINGHPDTTLPELNAPIEILVANSDIELPFSEGCYSTAGGTGDLVVADFVVTLTGGTATLPVLSVPLHSAGGNSISFTLAYTGTADGTEVLKIQPADGASVYDLAGNAMSASEQAIVTLDVV